jgi:NMD protein affecting ribosome stability and mRNA decay
MPLIKDIPAGYSPVLPDEVFFEERAERAYLEAATKLLEPTVCPQCDAIFMEGRWRWGPVPVSANQAVCPACQRMQDSNPAGYVVLAGPYFREHGDEILELIHEQAERKRGENPLMRLMEEERNEEAMLITTTDIRLAHFIGAALHHHFQGDLEYHHHAASDLLRVHWTR